MKIEIDTNDDSAMIEGSQFFAIIRCHDTGEYRFIHATSANSRLDVIHGHIKELMKIGPGLTAVIDSSSLA